MHTYIHKCGERERKRLKNKNEEEEEEEGMKERKKKKKKSYTRLKSQCKFYWLIQAKWEKMEHAERERGRTKLYMQANDGVMVA